MKHVTIGVVCAAALLTAATASSAGPAAGIKHAEAQFAKYTKLPAPLAIPAVGKKIPSGKTIALVGITSSVSQDGLKAAAAKLGWTVNVTVPPLNPDAYASALQSVLQQKPDGVVFWTPFPLSSFESQLQAFKAAGIPVVTQGGVGYPLGGSSPVIANGAGRNQFVPLAKLYVDSVVASAGKVPNVAFVTDPSVPAWKPMIDGFKTEIALAGGQYNEADVPLGDAFSGQAGSKVVSYLQSHPNINYLVFNVPQFALGVPQALATAGLSSKVKLIVGAADAPTIASVANGTFSAAIVLETGTGTWREADALARHFAGVKVYAPLLPTSYLIVTKKNLKLARNIETFPNQPAAFLKAWGLRK
jgi:ribose transport system substrate-binding protein